MGRRRFLHCFHWIAAVSVLILFSIPSPAASKQKKSASQPLTDQERALHALNRLTFGPRPGDVDRVLAMGVDNWIEQQLHPEQIPNGSLDARIRQFRTLQMQPK